MAVIKTEKIGFGDDHEWVRKWKCDTDGNFGVNLPPEVKAAGYKEPHGLGTMKEAETAYYDVIKEYENAEAVERKVIVYEWQEGSQWSRELSVKVAARVFIETTVGTMRPTYEVVTDSTLEDTKISSGIDDRSYMHHGESIMDWNQEAEDFFRQVGETLDRFGTIMESLIGEDVDNPGQAIIELRGSNQLPHFPTTYENMSEEQRESAQVIADIDASG